jgi:hypothetical protein
MSEKVRRQLRLGRFDSRAVPVMAIVPLFCAEEIVICARAPGGRTRGRPRAGGGPDAAARQADPILALRQE